MTARSRYMLGGSAIALALLLLANKLFGADLRRYIKIERM